MNCEHEQDGVCTERVNVCTVYHCLVTLVPLKITVKSSLIALVFNSIQNNEFRVPDDVILRMLRHSTPIQLKLISSVTVRNVAKTNI